jgi:hypothetical protein
MIVRLMMASRRRGKSGLLNDLYRASKVSAAEYASAAAEAAARDGARLELETYTPAPQERWRAAPPRLMPEQVQPGAEVDVYISCDDIWVPGRVLAVRTRAGGVLEAQVAEYDVLKDEDGNIAVDSTGAPLYGDVLLPDVSEFKAVSCCDEAAPAAIGNGIALRHVRTCRGAVEVADAPLVKGQHAAARNVRPVKESELDRYDGLLPEGTVGHTTEVREQVIVHGPLLGVTLVFAPFAPTAAAHAKLRAVLLAREAASPAKRPDYDKALAALTGDDTGDDNGASGDAAPVQRAGGRSSRRIVASDDEDDDAPTALTKREMELARAALGLPPGFNLASLKPADVPAELPREVAALLGRAVRFSPTCIGVRGDVQAAHERAVKRFLANNTRAVWGQPGPAGGKPALLWGNPLVSVIDRVVITTPCAAVAAGRVLVDTRGAERASLSSALAAANDASRSATAASLADAGAAVLMADARTDSTAVLDAARDGGIIKELAAAALKAHIEEARGISRQPRNVRVAVVIVGDKAWRDDALAALRGSSGPETSDALDRLRNLLESVAFANHKAALRDEIKTALLIKASDYLDDAAAHACAERVLNDEVLFIAVYPRVALGHAATPSIPPPASAAEADELAQTCGLLKLARFISGDGDGAAARAAAAKAAAALRRGLAALGHELALQKESPDALDRLRVYAHQVAPLADRIVVLNANAGGASAAAALDLGAWKAQLLTQLRPELEEMAAVLERACTVAEYGRVIAALIGHPFAPEEMPVPPSEFTGARADAAAGPLIALSRTGELGGMQLHELCIGPAVNWERGPTPDTIYGPPPMPPSLVFGWQGAGVSLLTPAPCAEAQIWATLRCALGRVHDVARRGVAALAGASEEDKARLHALLAVREADFTASVQRLVVDRFESINYAFAWREAEDATRAAGAAAAAAVLERVRKGKQASIVPKSEHKSVKSTKMWQMERAVPRVAAAAAAAYIEAAYSSLSDMASSLIADVHELVQKHCDELADMSDGALSQLNGARLWDALDTHVTATALAARLERMAAATAAAAPDEQLPERLLPRALVVALCQKLRAQLPSGATLGAALAMPAEAHATAMLDAAAAAAQSSSASAAASARALLARWRKPGDDPVRRAAWCRATLRTLQLAFGASASLRDSEPLRQFLYDAVDASALPAAEAADWPEKQTYALLCLCAEAGTLAGTAAFPRIQPAPAQLPRAERDWLAQATWLLSRQCAGGSSAVGPGTPPERKPLADCRAPHDWLGVPVRKLFVDPMTQQRRWYDGKVAGIIPRRSGSSWYRVVYDEDDDREDIELAELTVAAAAAAANSHRGALAPSSPPPAASAQADAANPAWPQRGMEAVRRHVALLQLSAAGGGPDVLSALRARFAPDRSLLLREEDGWAVARTVTKRGGVGDVQYCYYGAISADGKPTGMPAGRRVNDAGLAPTRIFSGPGAWLQVHHFRNGVAFVLPGGGGPSGGVRLSPQEEQAVRDAMTPRTVTRDGVPCPDEYVAEHRSEHRLGTWRWEFITRPQGDTKGTVDRYYHAPDGSRMRSLAEVQRHVAGRSGRLVDDDGDDSDDDVRTPARGGKKRALADEAEPSRHQGKRAAKDTERGFYAGQDD